MIQGQVWIPYIFVSVFTSIVLVGATVKTSLTTAKIVDLISAEALGEVTRTCLALMGYVIVLFAAGYFQSLVQSFVSYRMTEDLRMRMYRAILRAESEECAAFPKGDLLTRLGSQSSNAVRSIVALAGAVLDHVVGLIWYGCLLSWLLGPIAFACMAVGAAGLIYGKTRLGKEAESLGRSLAGLETEIGAKLNEALDRFTDIKLWSAEDRFIHDMRELIERRERLKRRALVVTTCVDGLGGATNILVTALGGALVTLFIATGSYSTGTFFAVMGFAAGLSRSMGGLLADVSGWLTTRGSWGQITEVLRLSAEQEKEQVTVVTPTVICEHLTYQYPHGEDPVIKELDLDVPSGSTLVVSGRSGSGKSTLIRLLAGILHPTRGEVMLAAPGTVVSPEHARGSIALVPQTPFLFEGTIIDNITLGQAYREEDICAALHQAAADEVVGELPEGLFTKLGPGGLGLSGGQKQRISLARALLRRPGLLLVDEGLSALDGRAVKEVWERLVTDRAMTKIMATHSSDMCGGFECETLRMDENTETIVAERGGEES